MGDVSAEPASDAEIECMAFTIQRWAEFRGVPLSAVLAKLTSAATAEVPDAVREVVAKFEARAAADDDWGGNPSVIWTGAANMLRVALAPPVEPHDPTVINLEPK